MAVGQLRRLHGGRFLLRNLLREPRESGEAEQGGDRESFDDLVLGFDPFVRGDLFYTPFTNEDSKSYKISEEFFKATDFA